MLNNKGFAVSTILYGILSLTIIILLLILGIMKSSKDMNQDLVNSLEESMNECAISEATLENCYFSGGNCNTSDFYSCIDKKGDVSNYLTTHILNNNEAKSDAKIDFSTVSSYTNGQGLYYTNNNTENGLRTYYFRGNVTNNYVSFAGITWRIVRINEDGSVRLITDKGVGSSVFNSNNDDNAYVGYMYGVAGKQTYSETHANVNNSTVKNYLDNWYLANLLNYSSYLADAGFCNDRSVAPTASTWYSSDTALGYGKNMTFYGSFNRLMSNVEWVVKDGAQPQFVCPQSSDLFTMSTSSKGNKTLNYPIGLITVDEVVYAGGANYIKNNSYYLNSGEVYWTMSPSHFNEVYTPMWAVSAEGTINDPSVALTGAVRPVINLKSSVEIVAGIGTKTNPYVIKSN